MAGGREAAMAYREVMMIEVKEILRLWVARVPKQHIARTLGIDRKTIRRYTELAAEQGLVPGRGDAHRRTAGSCPGRSQERRWAAAW
jgi:hypothetical protein